MTTETEREAAIERIFDAVPPTRDGMAPGTGTPAK